MRNKTLIVFLLASVLVQAQTVRMMEWNVENLFHPSNDSLTLDDEFTPEGDHRWTFGRFYHKINSIAQVIAASCDVAPRDGRNPFPDLVAMCEVESDSALVALTKKSVLNTMGYRFLCTHGCDRRGMNVALLYDPAEYRVCHWREVVVPGERYGYSPTRNLLYVCGQFVPTGDTLHVIVCHLPSQASGTRTADLNRQLAAETLKGVADSVLAVNPDARLVVTGDFNSTPDSRVMRTLASGSLHRLPFDYEGTYRYEGVWDYLDYVLCSRRVHADTVHVIHFPYMMEENKTYGGEQPLRSFRGKYYHGGVSDHLPIIVNLSLH